jgi:hypothetical protein
MKNCVITIVLLLLSSYNNCYGDANNNTVVRGSVREATTDSYRVNLESSIYGDRLYVTPRITYSKDDSDISLSMANLMIYGATQNYSPYISYSSLYEFTNQFAVLTGGSTGYNFAKCNGLSILCQQFIK